MEKKTFVKPRAIAPKIPNNNLNNHGAVKRTIDQKKNIEKHFQNEIFNLEESKKFQSDFWNIINSNQIAQTINNQQEIYQTMNDPILNEEVNQTIDDQLLNEQLNKPINQNQLLKEQPNQPIDYQIINEQLNQTIHYQMSNKQLNQIFPKQRNQIFNQQPSQIEIPTLFGNDQIDNEPTLNEWEINRPVQNSQPNQRISIDNIDFDKELFLKIINNAKQLKKLQSDEFKQFCIQNHLNVNPEVFGMLLFLISNKI